MNASLTHHSVPVRIRRERTSGVEITWQDGHRSFYPAEYLRACCPCAECVRERKGTVPLPVVSTPSVYPLALEQAGHYGLRVIWSDGHSEGIFRFSTLRNLCPCSSCIVSGERASC